MTDFTALHALRGETGEIVKTEIEQILITVRNREAIMAVDQSISNSGWVLIEDGYVVMSGNVITERIDSGHEDTLQRGEEIFKAFMKLIHDYLPANIVYEYPPIGSPRMMRPEASLVAAMAIRAAAYISGVKVLMPVNAQKVKKRLTGNGNATKADLKRAIMAMDPTLKNLSPKNQAVMDAIGIGWVAMERGEF